MREDLKVGDRMIDNDPRMGGRVVEIVELYPNSVRARDARGRNRIYLKDRIFTDGKPRKYGYNVLRDAEAA